ncbi:COX15/CtaA family protein [Leifsonia shinshuensis]|uniref:Cytochrome c oxidase assembly protein subunit 15 n=1 Tax=Leifsonia shinshuensis TaxID=150026 RepID=A0A853CTG6_9MICO|nr:COX15/CtaA family protein [Leifsonia shinshuensis]NYJ23977.1 cytochrome c oxidase assembly protein subunit 15 [Leifsonia shinshuensis]
MKRIIAWLPDRVDRRTKVVAWLYLAAQILLVTTGGAVRLTSSGLGCPTWPKCTADSFVNTPEMGIHGVIEFGNRMLGGVLAILAILAFLMVVKLLRSRRDLFWLAFVAGLGVPFQAVLGGITVLTGLTWWVVGLHFVTSIVLVVLTTVLLVRVYAVPGPRVRAVPGWYAAVAYVTSAVVGVTILFGIVTTGTGPHAGDAKTPRTGLNPELIEHVHAIPAYATFALTLVLVVGAWRITGTPVRRFTLLLLGVELVQIAVGLIQSNTGLPGVLVGIHMTLAATLAAMMTAVVMSLTAARRPATVEAGSAAEAVSA